MAAIEEVKTPEFFVGIGFEKVGMERPSVRQIVAPVEAWLSGSGPGCDRPHAARRAETSV
jgi:hypothetical protein